MQARLNPLARFAVALGIGSGGFPGDAWSQARRLAWNEREAIALTDINLIAGAPATVALVDTSCRLVGKVEHMKPIDSHTPRIVMNGGWWLSFHTKSCTQQGGSVDHRPYGGGTELASALKRGDRVTVTDHAR